LVQGIGLQFLIRIIGIATGIAVAAALARGLSRPDFGTFSLVLSLAAMATTLLDLGISSTAVRQVSVQPRQTPTIAGALVVIRGFGGILGALLIVGVVLVVDPRGNSILTAALIGASFLLSPLSALQPIAQAQLRLGAINVLMLLQSLLWTATVVSLSVLEAPLPAFAAGFLVVALLQSVANWVAFKAHVRVTFAGALRQTKVLFRHAWPVALGGLFVTAYYRLDSVILYAYQGPVATAYFSAAYRFLDVLQVLPATLLSIAMPLLAATWREGRHDPDGRRQRLFSLSLRALMAAALPIAAGGALVADALIRAVYGTGFSGASHLLAILLLGLPAVSVGYIAVGLALASGRTRLYACIAAVGAVVNVGLNLWLIPIAGATAAAWTTVGTEYGVGIALLMALTRTVDVHLPWGSWCKAGVATACLVLAVAPIRHWPLPWSVAIGATVFILAAAAMRLVTMAEIKSLTRRETLEGV
jgi:O-antigen/teichoic acid export membrane protein